MSKPEKYLVIAPFAPSNDPAGATAIAIAQVLSQQGSVTCVIDDLSADIPDADELMAIRRSVFEKDFSDYQHHKRIYCLGNSYESLFVLELLHEYPGLIITQDGTYHDLILSLFRSQKGWPNNYTDWLLEALGENGRAISYSLLQHRRLSKSIGIEVLDRAPLAFNKHKEIMLSQDRLFPYIPKFKQQGSKSTEPKTVLCINMPAETIDAANGDMENLGKDIHLKSCHAANPSLIKYINEASIIVLNSDGTPSPALSYSLQLGKAIIVAGHAWHSPLPVGSHLRIDNARARHQLVAAIGAISIDPSLKSNLETAARKHWQLDTQNAKLDELIQLSKQQPALKAPAELKSRASEQPNKMADTGSAPIADVLLDEKASVPAALIGSVPATSLIQKILPGIDPECSPRFATPALVRALSIFDHDDTHSLLASLGFETPVINTEPDANKTGHQAIAHLYDWPVVQSGLRNSDYTISFNAKLTNVPAVQHMDTDFLASHYGTEMIFADSLSSFIQQKTIPIFDRVMGHMDGPGLFWELDKARCCIKCIMIVGIAGIYTLQNLNEISSNTFIVSNNQHASELNKDLITLQASDDGILNFSIRAIDAETKAPLDSMFLLKSLAQVHLKLEWSSHE